MLQFAIEMWKRSVNTKVGVDLQNLRQTRKNKKPRENSHIQPICSWKWPLYNEVFSTAAQVKQLIGLVTAENHKTLRKGEETWRQEPKKKKLTGVTYYMRKLVPLYNLQTALFLCLSSHHYGSEEEKKKVEETRLFATAVWKERL